MKILYIDSDKTVINIIRRILNKIGIDKEIEAKVLCCCIKEAWEYYQKEEFDFVIIDLSLAKLKAYTLIDNIIKIDPKQKIITLSDGLTSINRPSVKEGCEYCKKNYNRVRIPKPIRVNTLRNAILNFENATCSFNFQ